MLIGFITASDLSRYFPARDAPLFTHDDFAAKCGLEDAGHVVEPVIWGSPVSGLRKFDLLIVRSPWDYMETDEKRRGLFSWLQEVAAAGIRLQNDIAWLLWNSDKIYLKELAAGGVPVVPTRFLGADQHVGNAELAAYFRDQGPFVLKPAVSAAARDTFLIKHADVASCLNGLNGHVNGDFAAWRSGRTFMIQPFLQEITTEGEWSFVYFAGAFSHSVHKRPAHGQWLVQDELGGSVLSEQAPAPVLTVAEQAVRALGEIRAPLPLYMRVDVIPTSTAALVGEIELIEPELFFLSRLPGGRTLLNKDAVSSFVAAVSA